MPSVCAKGVALVFVGCILAVGQPPKRTVQERQTLFFRHLFMSIANLDDSERQLSAAESLVAVQYDLDSGEISVLHSAATAFHGVLLQLRSDAAPVLAGLGNSATAATSQAQVAALITSRDNAVNSLAGAMLVQFRASTAARLRDAAANSR